MYFSSLAGPEGDAEVLEALAEYRVRLQAAIGRQARLRRTPELSFRADSGVREGFRVEEILRDIDPAARRRGRRHRRGRTTPTLPTLDWRRRPTAPAEDAGDGRDDRWPRRIART